ncbi:Transmembrane protein 66 [Aspergillus hancockii]|nr:Transmembrane protein 66 [Aspergillus hancockii]
MRCTNAGYDYDEEDVQWTCTASLPQEFKLGSTDVVCEGYRNADDKWVLKGSCGVEYRLLLTEQGEKIFGRGRDDTWPRTSSNKEVRDGVALLGDIIFFGFIIAVFALILWPMVRGCFGLRGNRRGRTFDGDGGGGGDGGRGPYPGPPPPYSSFPDSSTFASAPTGQGWRPGFWTGALGGGAAGYGLGRMHNRYDSPGYGRRTTSFRRWDDTYDPGEGSSRHRSPQLSTPTTSTGFGSTRRR